MSHSFVLLPILFFCFVPGIAHPATTSETPDVFNWQVRYKIGADFERLPDRFNRTEGSEKGVFTELGLKTAAGMNKTWSLFSDIRGFAANSQLTSTFDDIETGRTRKTSNANNYLQWRQLWIRYSGMTDYPGEHLTLGLQRIRSSSALWWDSDIESLVWRFSSTRFQFQGGLGEHFDTYRTNNELNEIDQNKFRLFAEGSYDWKAYHAINLRGLYTHQHSHDIPRDVQSGTPDGVNGEWLWYGVGLSSNWTERRSRSSFAYNFEWIGLTGHSDFLSTDGTVLKNHDISAWAVDAGLRYDFHELPASFGVTFSQGSGGFTKHQSNLFVQTGLHSNRSKYVGNNQYLFRFNDALRPDLTNLIHESFFASYTLREDYLIAGAVSNFQRDKKQFPIYRNNQPLNMNHNSHDVGLGLDLIMRQELHTSIFNIPLKYVRVRSSAFFPGNAFDSDSDDTSYRVVLELVGIFE